MQFLNSTVSLVWNAENGDSKLITGRLHANQVSAMTTVGDQVASIGVDDKLKFFGTADNEYTYVLTYINICIN